MRMLRASWPGTMECTLSPVLWIRRSFVLVVVFVRRGLLSLNGIGFCCIFVALRVVLVVTRLRICAYALSSFLLRFLAVLSHGVHVAGFADELSGDARKRVELIRGAKKM